MVCFAVYKKEGLIRLTLGEKRNLYSLKTGMVSLYKIGFMASPIYPSVQSTMILISLVMR